MIITLLILVLAAFGWHSLYMWLAWDFHPVRVVAEVLAMLLIYHLGRKLIDRIGEGKAK